MVREKTERNDQNVLRMITPYLSASKIKKLDNHVKLGHAKSRADMVRICVDYWLDNHLLPEEIDVLKLQARMKQDGQQTITSKGFGDLTCDELADGIKAALGNDGRFIPSEMFDKISTFLLEKYNVK